MTGLVSAALLLLSLTASVLLPPAPTAVPTAPATAPPTAPSVYAAPEAGLAPDAVWPLAPRPEVVTAFSPPAQRWEAGHRGVDLAGYPGQEVRAAVPGTVTFAGTVAGRGVIVVNHGDRRTTYEPVSATSRVGDVVGAGEVIGTLQASPGHCTPRTCLHWGLIAGTEYQDPLGLLSLGPVRLLPLFPDLVRPVGAPGDRRFAGARW